MLTPFSYPSSFQTSPVTTDGLDSGTVVTVIFGITAAIMTTINLWQNRHYFRNVRTSLHGPGKSNGPGLPIRIRLTIPQN